MGLTSYLNSLNPFASASGTDRRAEEVRSGARAPDRTERRRCWEARDAYFACLDRSGILDPVKDEKAAAQACRAEGAGFDDNCAREWVTYFKKWRVANHEKQMRIAQLETEGAKAVEITGGPGGPPAGS